MPAKAIGPLRRVGDAYPGQPTWWRGWQYTTEADAGNKSLEMVNSALSNEIGQNWAASTVNYGTPGAVNSNTLLTPDIAPMILDVTHFPVIPKSTDPVTITAQIVDELTTGLTVNLHYRVDKTGTPNPFTVDRHVRRRPDRRPRRRFGWRRDFYGRFGRHARQNHHRLLCRSHGCRTHMPELGPLPPTPSARKGPMRYFRSTTPFMPATSRFTN